MMNKERIKQVTEKLSVRKGGNVFFEKKLLKQDEQSVCVFIGLGGLGCKAVNEIKMLTEENMADANKRFFLAIDSDALQLQQLQQNNFDDDYREEQTLRGRLDEQETIVLRDPPRPLVPSDIDVCMQQWFPVDLLHNGVFDGSTAAIRAVGRAMLFANNNYRRIELKIREVLENANAQRYQTNANNIRVYVIAGVAGGTGGGIIIDIGYMIRKIVYWLGQNAFCVLGCIFTPEVQLNDSGIQGNVSREVLLKSNFYAAMKEIDYFYNNRERNKKYIAPIYPDSFESEESIFDECRLIGRKSPNGDNLCQDSREVIRKFAQGVVCEIASVADRTGNAYSYAAFLRSVPSRVHGWRYTDNAMGMRLPDWAPPRYSAFGYGSYYVPTNELFAYGANKVMERLRERWNLRNISEPESEGLMCRLSLADARCFASKLFELAGVESAFEVDRRILPHDPFMPGPIVNVDKYIQELESITRNVCSPIFMKRYIRDAEGPGLGELQQGFTWPFLAIVKEALREGGRGPAYAISLLSGERGTLFGMPNYGEGVLTRIEHIMHSMHIEVALWRQELQILKSDLMNDADELKTFKIGQHDPGMVQRFIDGYMSLCKSMAKTYLLENSEEYLRKIYDILQKESQKVFMYADVIEAVFETLGNDTDYVLNPNRRRDGDALPFAFDLTNFESNDPMAQKLLGFMDRIIDQMDESVLEERFIHAVYDEVEEISETEDPDAAATKLEQSLHNYFCSVFGEWAYNPVEKILCVVCASENVTLQQVLEDFYDDNLRYELAGVAAGEIYRKLCQQSEVLLTSADSWRSADRFADFEMMGAPSETSDINASFNIPYLNERSCQSEFYHYRAIVGFPLFLLDGLKEYRRCYEAIGNVVQGVHLDEVGEDCWRLFPEPYSYFAAEALGFYVDEPDEVTLKDKQYLEHLFKMAVLAKKMGLLRIEAEGQDFYSLTYGLARELTDDAQTIRTKMEAGYAASKGDFVTVLSASGYNVLESLPIRWYAIHPFYDIMDNKTDFGDETKFGNFIYLLYSNVEWRSKLEKAIEVFEPLYTIYSEICND